MARKILIADDDKVLTKILGSFLEENGYRVIVAHDGDEALAKFQSEDPDLVVLDVVMPNINGYSFLFEMKKLDHGAQTPVIILTCKEEMADIFKIEGVKEYVIKPVVNKDLLEKIRKHVG